MLSDLERSCFEPFFFFTEGHGVTYLATQEEDSTYEQTYRATGSFQNINGRKDGKYIYYIDGRYSDQMNKTSIVDRVNITDTTRHTQAQTKQFIKKQLIQGVNVDTVTLYSYDTYYWFVNNKVC